MPLLKKIIECNANAFLLNPVSYVYRCGNDTSRFCRILSISIARVNETTNFGRDFSLAGDFLWCWKFRAHLLGQDS